MNKGELVKAISVEALVSQKEADNVLTATLEVIQNAVSNGDKVTLVGFGTFEAREYAERQGRNPATGEAMLIPAGKKVAFSAGKNFKEIVNG